MQNFEAIKLENTLHKIKHAILTEKTVHINNFDCIQQCETPTLESSRLCHQSL